MQTMIFEDTIEKDTIRNLIKEITTILKEEDNTEILKIYFSTPGGALDTAGVLIDFLNENADRILLYATDQISSAGILIFFGFTGKRVVMNHTYSIIHTGSTSLETRDLLDKESRATFFKTRILKEMNKSMYSLLESLEVDEAIIGALMQGKDKYLSDKDLKRMLKVQQKKKKDET